MRHKLILLVLLVITIASVIGCEPPDGATIDKNVVDAIGPAVSDLSDGFESANELAHCMFNYSAGVLVCAGRIGE